MAAAVNDIPWLAKGRTYLGLKEAPGSANNPTIVGWGQKAGISWYRRDADAWCAVFVNGILAECGLPGTRDALARSFTWSSPDFIKLDPKHPVVGAIVVFPRGSDPTFGHVGFIDAVEKTTIKVLNGNVSDMVKISTFTRASIIGLVWPASAPLPSGAARLGAPAKDDGVLRRGASGSAVLDLQKDLNVLGYALRESGAFDAATEDAVRRFQARRDLKVDGEAGPATRSALSAAVAARQAEVKPLPSGGAAASGTIKAAAGTVLTAATGAALEVSKSVSADDVANAVQAGKDVAGVVRDNQDQLSAGSWLGLAFFLLAVAFGVFMIWKRYRDAGQLPSWLGGTAAQDDVPEVG